MAAGPVFTRIGRYRIESLVGEGSMAHVYRAHDPDIDRTVAIKILKHERDANEQYFARFLREAQSAGALSHPNIVTIFDVGRIKDVPYIAMEFLKEKSLADVLDGPDPLPLKSVLAVAIQLARTLDYAHKQGIVHRDVKPGNILLIDGGDTIKITDFGLARFERPSELHKTYAGTVLGTPRYMSPEQALGRDADGRSDLFSVGAILYELLTGKKAFAGDNLATLMLQITQESPVPIGAIAPEVPKGLQRIVAKLLRKIPEQRFQTGAELATALERELAAVTAQEVEKRHNRFLPLRFKLAGLAAGTLAILFTATMAIVYEVEAHVIRSQILESGASLAKFIAVETAVPVLSKNWVPLELLVADQKARHSYDYLVVTDHHHVVKAATDPALVGKPFVPPRQNEVMRFADVSASSADMRDGSTMFLFNTPILFQNTEIGRVYLGLDQAGEANVLRATLILITTLGILSVLAVGGMSWFFGTLLSRPFRVLLAGMTDLGQGDLDRRISEDRSDEIGHLFVAFNHMADRLQLRLHAAKPEKARKKPAATAAPPILPAGDPEATIIASNPKAKFKATGS